MFVAFGDWKLINIEQNGAGEMNPPSGSNTQDTTEADHSSEMTFFVHDGQGPESVFRKGLHHLILVFI